MTPEWIVEALAPAHDTRDFNCGVEELDDFLRKGAGQYRRRGLGQTFVAVPAYDDTRRVLGYYTVAAGKVSIDELPAAEAKGLPKRIGVPVMHLGRLAVDRSVQGRGLGEHLLMHALWHAHHIAQQLGVRAVDLFAINEAARQFYLRYGFIELRDNPNHLYIALATVAALFPRT